MSRKFPSKLFICKLKGVLLAILMSVLIFVNALGQTIDRGPYLQTVTTESIFIKWRTDIPTNSKVWYGDSPSNLNLTLSSGVSVEDHEILIDGLNTNTTYFYAVGNSNGQMVGGDDSHYFKTTPDTSGIQTIRAWVLGDAGTANTDQRDVRDAYYNFIGEEHTDAILMLGDNAYTDGTQSEYQLAVFEDMYEEKLINSVMWSTFGNHDGNSSISTTQTGPYYEIFTFPKNGEAGGLPSETEAYYSFDYGNTHFISINSDDIDADPEGDMVQWLENDLNSTTQEWIVAFFHHPPYTGEGGNESDIKTSSTEMRENIVPVLEAGEVDLVLSGHTHAYQRSYLIRGHYDVSSTWDSNSMGIDLGDGRIDGDSPYFKERGNSGIGTVYVVAGSSGKLYNDDYNYPAMSQNVEKLGSVAIEVNGLQMDVKFIDFEGIIQDYFTILKMEDPPFVNITYPSDQEYFPVPETITITADASDSNGIITQVEFFIDNISIGTDVGEPYSIDWTIPVNGNYKIKAVATDNDGYFRSSIVEINVGVLEACFRVNSSNDDAEEKTDGSVSLTSGDLELVNDDSDQTIGIRFKNLNIPQCSEINSAYIQFAVEGTDNINPCSLNIYAEASDNASTFNNDDWNLTSRPKTVATVVWSPEDWENIGNVGPNQRTVDIGPLIQEVVNRPGFSPNSSIVILIDGVGKRSAESYDGDQLLASELCIEYISIGPDDDNDGVCNALDQCPGGPEPGMSCDDGDPQTSNDTVNTNCECVGMYDCPSISANIGDSCDDGIPETYGDIIDANCNCIGLPYDCPIIFANIGDSCDDGNPNTPNDVITANCECVGEFDCPSISANIGDPCDDGNPDTSNDLINTNCECVGEFDCPSISANIGDACDDGIPETYDDVIDSNCECIGTLYDCPLILANIGDSCDDGNPNTPNDVITANCECLGDFDCPSISANIGDACDDGNSETSNDIINSDCECVGMYDCPSIPANIGDVCDDGDPETYNDTIDSNCTCIGIIYDCVSISANIGDPCDDGNENTIGDAVDSNCDCIGSSYIAVNIISSSDDAEESEMGLVNVSSSDLELVVDGNVSQFVGMRFSNLEINQGAVIDSAFIQFTADEANNLNPCSLNIYGEASDDAETFTNGNNNISSRPKTNASLIWSPEDWETIGENGIAQRTVDITSVVQEIVDRTGFNSNSSIVIIVEGIGRRIAVSYDGDAENAPQLNIKYKNSIVGIDDAPKPEISPILVYPVPATEYLNISFNCSRKQKVAVKIMDLNGRLIYTDTQQAVIGRNNLLIDNLVLENGMYFIQLSFEGTIQTAKFTIFK